MATVFVLVAAATARADRLTDMEVLGKFLFYQGISTPESMACAVCHGPSVGFTGPDAEINRHGSVYRGAVPERFGNRKPPSSAYTPFSPVLHYDQKKGFLGGSFWDGRATGKHLGNPAAEQAQGPFLNPVEQNNRYQSGPEQSPFELLHSFSLMMQQGIPTAALLSKCTGVSQTYSSNPLSSLPI